MCIQNRTNHISQQYIAACKTVSDLQIFQCYCCWLSTDYRKGNHRLYWEEPKEVTGKKIEFTGEPLYIMGCKLFDCQHGKDRNAALKRKHQRQRDEVIKYISNPGVMIPPSTVNYYISYFDPNY